MRAPGYHLEATRLMATVIGLGHQAIMLLSDRSRGIFWRLDSADHFGSFGNSPCKNH